jgi:hypothetical protein
MIDQTSFKRLILRHASQMAIRQIPVFDSDASTGVQRRLLRHAGVERYKKYSRR